MNPLLNQFITEARDFLQAISQQLLALEQHPEQHELIVELFRLVHTLKGNSGLFEFGAMSKVLHAAEDVMDAVRDTRLAFTPKLADALLESMDFVAQVVDSVAAQDYDDLKWTAAAASFSRDLRQLLPSAAVVAADPQAMATTSVVHDEKSRLLAVFEQLPAAVKALATTHPHCFFVVYQPEADCYFKGEDPFYLSQQIPDLIWGAAEILPTAATLDYDCFRSNSRFLAMTVASEEALSLHFRYVPEQVTWTALPTEQKLPMSQLDPLHLDDAVLHILQTQQQILQLALGRGALDSVRATLKSLAKNLPQGREIAPVPDAQTDLLEWVAQLLSRNICSAQDDGPEAATAEASGTVQIASSPPTTAEENATELQAEPSSESKYGRRAEDQVAGKVLKVEQSKIDRLMDLIGEIVVAKNSLPYLATKAEEQFGVRELSRDIKAQYAVINRIVEEMQDAIMQVRMLPVSFIFQRFPRLVRDIARKLNKEVELQIHGEETEADKSIIESLADPLIHILRNSLDHGLETADERLA